MHTDEAALVDSIRSALLDGLRVDLSPEQGQNAFERHQLLAIRFHRAARLNSPATGERAAWLTYFKEHFPRGDEYAELLWVRWRIALVKDEYPGAGIAISHGQPHAHWRQVDPGQRLFINLESMWNDFETSVESFIALLRQDEARRLATLDWWRTRQTTVALFTFTRSAAVPVTPTAAGAATATGHVQ